MTFKYIIQAFAAINSMNHSYLNAFQFYPLNPVPLFHCRGKRGYYTSFLRKHLFIILLIMGVCAGIGLGIGLRFVPAFSDPKRATRLISYINFPGELMLRVMSMLMVPIIVSSLVSAVASMELGKTGKVCN